MIKGSQIVSQTIRKRRTKRARIDAGLLEEFTCDSVNL